MIGKIHSRVHAISTHFTVNRLLALNRQIPEPSIQQPRTLYEEFSYLIKVREIIEGILRFTRHMPC